MKKIYLIITISILMTSCISTSYFTRKYYGANVHVVFKNIGEENIELVYIKFDERKSYPTTLNRGGEKSISFFSHYITKFYQLHYKVKEREEIIRTIKTPSDLPVESFKRDKLHIRIIISLDGSTETEEIIYGLYKLGPRMINGKFNNKPAKKYTTTNLKLIFIK